MLPAALRVSNVAQRVSSIQLVSTHATSSLLTGTTRTVLVRPVVRSTLGLGSALGRRGVLARSLSQAATTGVTTGATVGLQCSPAVTVWLLGCTGAVVTMIALGATTRLTRSGLSMVEWRPQGSALPSGDEQWAVEFDKYKQFPEYKELNSSMTLEEFKSIYFMEWFHRMFGRGAGLLFGLPLVFFAVAGKVPRALVPRLVGMFALGGAQGLIGWWMVKSGLSRDTIVTAEPRVSPYRLTAHLAMAVGLESLLLWTALDTMRRPVMLPGPVTVRAASALRLPALLVTGLVGTTMLSGAFVAGNDAGHAYNDWPLMAGRFVPEQIWMNDLGWRNIFQNTATVQFDHRMLAYSTLGGVATLVYLSRRPGSWSALPRDVRLAVTSMAHMSGIQVLLGIGTLVMYVPVPIAVAHQIGAVTLWSCGIWLLHGLRRVAPVAARAVAH